LLGFSLVSRKANIIIYGVWLAVNFRVGTNILKPRNLQGFAPFSRNVADWLKVEGSPQLLSFDDGDWLK
jgi:hypothetical protein